MQYLVPNLDLLSQEYVLVQAWKKTAAYIRYHNWFADTLELDRAAADLPRFISRLSQRLRSGEYLTSEIRIVPAPKSHPWIIDEDNRWRPLSNREVKIRPLAHVSLADQVVATAIMLCLSERIETRQGDPSTAYQSAAQRSEVLSYGNRLFCDFDPERKALIHRWGSSKLYRAYFQDYRSFLARPEYVATSVGSEGRTFVLQTDLKQFYDRVRPALLQTKLGGFLANEDDNGFRNLVSNLFSWKWSSSSELRARQYANVAGIAEYSTVALPQPDRCDVPMSSHR